MICSTLQLSMCVLEWVHEFDFKTVTDIGKRRMTDSCTPTHLSGCFLAADGRQQQMQETPAWQYALASTAVHVWWVVSKGGGGTVDWKVTLPDHQCPPFAALLAKLSCACRTLNIIRSTTRAALLGTRVLPAFQMKNLKRKHAPNTNEQRTPRSHCESAT